MRSARNISSQPENAGRMQTASILARVFLQEDINFLVTNRIPRRYLTLWIGWFSRIRSPRLTRVSVAVWRLFSPDLQFDDAKSRNFASLQDCFARELREGARPIDPDPCVVTSPCDAVIGAFGTVQGGQAIQAKGFPYSLMDLLNDERLVARHRGGKFVTLRLRSSMYHRFHAPCDGRVQEVKYISGDTWNVNPIALKRVERLFCKNERAVIPMELSAPGSYLTLVPVAAILVASIRLHFIAPLLHLRYRGTNEIPCNAAFVKGQEMGYFESGSTIVLFTTREFDFPSHIAEGRTIRVGEALLTCRTPISQTTGEDNERFQPECV
jgi:phosphatidylserine decarboxylase